MRKGGDMAAVVFVTSKPVDAFARSNWDPGFKFLPVSYDTRFEDHYLPTSLSTTDYPQLIKGDQVQTIAVPTILAAYNWPRSTERYRRVSRFVDYLYNRIDKLHEAGFHPKWKDVESVGQRAGPDARTRGAGMARPRGRKRPREHGYAKQASRCRRDPCTGRARFPRQPGRGGSFVP